VEPRPIAGAGPGGDARPGRPSIRGLPLRIIEGLALLVALLVPQLRRLALRGLRLPPNLRLGLLGVGLVLAGLFAALVMSPVSAQQAITGRSAHAAHAATLAAAAQVTSGNRSGDLGAPSTPLPVATASPGGTPAALAAAPPLATREDFAFAPYWTLPQSGTFSLTGLSTLAYFSVGVNANGTLDESGPGWNGYQSQAFSNLITRAHAAGERVVLTVNDFDQGSLNALTSSASAPATLAAALIPALQAKSLDGVNFDFEGEGSGDQAGLTRLIAAVSGALRNADSHWQITMDTYASSAGDPGGFYNIPALAPYVDAFFVMAYELNLQGSSTSGSPLTSGMFSDLTTLEQYTAAVPASKVILGTPFFGIDWPTDNGTMGARAAGPAADVADAQLEGEGNPEYWDPATDTGWTSYQVGSQWHESYFEDPYGLYEVAQLAAHYGVRGVGIWALGMEDDDAQMIAALDGALPPGGPGGTGPASTSTSPSAAPAPVVVAAAPPAGAPGATAHANGPVDPTPTTSPPASSTSTTAPSTSTTQPAPTPTTTTTAPSGAITGTFDGTIRELTPVAPGSVDSLLSLGTLTGFTTTNPAYACLAHGPPLAVYMYGSLSGYDVAVASTPTDCMTQDFIFHS
jgi:hypothetical protein